MPPSTHIPILLRSLSHQYDAGMLSNDFIIFSKEGSEPLSWAPHVENLNQMGLSKAVLVVFDRADGDFLEQLATYLSQRNWHNVTFNQSNEPTGERLPHKIAIANDINPSLDFLKPEDVFLLKINAIIEANMEKEACRPAFLAKSCYICEMQLHRKLKKLANLSPANYIKKYRLHRSQKLLLSGQYSISQVAYMVGFKTPEHFTNSFRKKFGQCPSAFIRQWME